MVKIVFEFLSESNVWTPAGTRSESNQNYITKRLTELAKSHNGKRVRARYSNGTIIDIL